jgi:hypothetical protein
MKEGTYNRIVAGKMYTQKKVHRINRRRGKKESFIRHNLICLKNI